MASDRAVRGRHSVAKATRRAPTSSDELRTTGTRLEMPNRGRTDKTGASIRVFAGRPHKRWGVRPSTRSREARTLLLAVLNSSDGNCISRVGVCHFFSPPITGFGFKAKPVTTSLVVYVGIGSPPTKHTTRLLRVEAPPLSNARGLQ